MLTPQEKHFPFNVIYDLLAFTLLSAHKTLKSWMEKI